ncbi:uncharacterized protein EDB93DRAFT_886387 [Suillus bovinus]|uniref:uncharacterized protein n=1 Tax=Suillus bovinus TaxID=48563 RepID=UPI001B875F27|nr:uncharacterized protein EDB93DRAFT_886387 [Suillus bovinus]KAG2133243.1 hypothetical protein EDB93DRAFT_886387 [Suillus bovinus]
MLPRLRTVRSFAAFNIPRESLLCDFTNNFRFDLVGISLDADFLFTTYAETFTLINEISSLRFHFGNLSAVWWYIKLECHRYTFTKFSRSHPSSNTMSQVLNDPSWWPVINANIISSYFTVAACAAVIYDWGVAFGQEVELVWRQRWSLMTAMYLLLRYVGIGYSVMNMLVSNPTISTTNAVRLIMGVTVDWTSEAAQIILGVIMITRLHAMYQRSRKVLIFLVVIFLAIRIANVIMVAIQMMEISTAEEIILSGTYQCTVGYTGDFLFLASMTWILATVWEVFALCLAVWIAVKHFRELRQHSTGSVIGDCFTVLMKTHVSYFASFLVIACLHIGLFSPTLLADLLSLDVQIYLGLAEIFGVVQLSVLGPRLILDVREYNAKLVADSDTTSTMTSIAFQEHVHVETSSSV